MFKWLFVLSILFVFKCPVKHCDAVQTKVYHFYYICSKAMNKSLIENVSYTSLCGLFICLVQLPNNNNKKKPIEALFSFCENILGCNLQRRKNVSTFRADRLSKLKFILPRIYTGQKTESKSAWRLFFVLYLLLVFGKRSQCSATTSGCDERFALKLQCQNP